MCEFIMFLDIYNSTSDQEMSPTPKITAGKCNIYLYDTVSRNRNNFTAAHHTLSPADLTGELLAPVLSASSVLVIMLLFASIFIIAFIIIVQKRKKKGKIIN